MKKIFLFAALPALVLTGCSSDEILDTQKTAIEFNNVFVNKSSRAESLTEENIKTCNVWGSSSLANAYIFNSTTVTITNPTTTSYSPVQYWTANSTYYFMAISSLKGVKDWGFTAPDAIPTAEGTFGTLTFDNTATGAAGCDDIVFASATRTQGETINDAAVNLNFKHALSRTRFMFTNNMGENYKIKVSNVVVSGTPAKGTLDFNQNPPTWTTEETTTVSYAVNVPAGSTDGLVNSTTDTDRQFLIPGTTDFAVSFDIDLYLTNASGENIHVNGETPYHHTIPITQDLAIGTAYLFRTTIGADNIDPENPLKPITFTVSVDPWGTAQNVDIAVPDVQP